MLRTAPTPRRIKPCSHVPPTGKSRIFRTSRGFPPGTSITRSGTPSFVGMPKKAIFPLSVDHKTKESCDPCSVPSRAVGVVEPTKLRSQNRVTLSGPSAEKTSFVPSGETAKSGAPLNAGFGGKCTCKRITGPVTAGERLDRKNDHHSPKTTPAAAIATTGISHFPFRRAFRASAVWPDLFDWLCRTGYRGGFEVAVSHLDANHSRGWRKEKSATRPGTTGKAPVKSRERQP